MSSNELRVNALGAVLVINNNATIKSNRTSGIEARNGSSVLLNAVTVEGNVDGIKLGEIRSNPVGEPNPCCGPLRPFL